MRHIKNETLMSVLEDKKINRGHICRQLVLLLILSVSFPVFAAEGDKEKKAAGITVFVNGAAVAGTKDGALRKLKKGDPVYAGDTIETGDKGMVQVRMSDEGFISIKANSLFRIDEYEFNNDKEDKGFFSLVKGGFRAITGVIGKEKKDSYKVKTPIASIGIRGTDYTAQLCDADCSLAFKGSGDDEQISEGLYIGVVVGEVIVSNDSGELTVSHRQFAFVKDGNTVPQYRMSLPRHLLQPQLPPPVRSEDGSGHPEQQAALPPKTALPIRDVKNREFINETVNREFESANTVTSVEGNSLSLVQGIVPNRQIAVASGPVGIASNFTDVTTQTVETIYTTNIGVIESFMSGYPTGAGTVDVIYQEGTTVQVDAGLDPITHISWGRWTNGTVNINGTPTEDLAANSTSIHWIAGPAYFTPVSIPTTGTANFVLVGNTQPTDNFGNTGVLGAASMSADFTSQTVDASFDIGINNQVWNSTATGMAINPDATFSGAATGTATDIGSGLTPAINGSVSGFFVSNPDTNLINGAGTSYSLEADFGGTATTVSGTAAFEQQ